MFHLLPDSEVIVRFGQEPQNSEKKAEQIDLLVWNVYKGQRRDLFAQDFKLLLQNRDFILLQEAFKDQHMPRLWNDHAQDWQWNMAQSFAYKKNLHSTGVCIGSPYASLHLDYFLAQDREFFWLTPKVTLFSQFRVNGQDCLMVNTHVLNFVTTKVFIRCLEGIAAKIGKFTGPVVLAGDFNTWNMQRMLAMKDIFKNLKLEPIEFANDKRFLRLDHVFVRGFEPVKARILSHIRSSDHYPLELTLKLKA